MTAYQVIVLLGGSTPFEQGIERTLRSELARKLGELGLDPTELAILSAHDVPARLNDALATVAVFISNTHQPVHQPALDELKQRAILTLPYVSTLKDFQRLVPPALSAINGLEPSPADTSHEKLVGRVLEELRLLRRQRSVFISYRRVESAGVAAQLREQLQARRYDVFLDSYSVEYGVDFQSALWNELGNTDVVVLLNTPTVFSSEWVEKEVTRTSAAGIAMLRLIWPNVTPQRDIDFAEPVYLNDADFIGGSSAGGETAQLLPAQVGTLAAQVEQLRARAHAARRRRVVAELQAAANSAGLQMVLEHDGVVRLERAATALTAGATKRVIPVIGYPSALVLEEHALAVSPGSPAWDHLLYDSLGMLEPAYARHLTWLNSYLPTKSVAIQGIEQWIAKNLS